LQKRITRRNRDDSRMNPNECYEVVDGKVITRSLEIHVVDHCNLRCWGCCSLSPISSKFLASPESIAKDLNLAKLVIAPSRLKLVGGEPLLHPDILECITCAKESNIAPSVSITTNGFMLPKMKSEFWELIDHMTISLYPTPALPDDVIQQVKDLACEYGVDLNWKTQQSFVGMDRDEADSEGLETEKVYSECWLRRRCHLIAHGRFYTCTRPSHFHAVSGLEESPYLKDGVRLEAGNNVYDYLVSKKPLKSCFLCLGGDAESEPHRQLNLAEIKSERITRQRLYQHYAEAISN